MKILYLTNGFPFPLTSGYLRHFHFIRELSSRHEIVLFSLVKPTFRSEHADAMAPYVDRVATFPVESADQSPAGKLRQGVRLLTHSDPAVQRMAEKARETCREWSADVVLFSGKHTLPALGGIGDRPVVADICDAASVRVGRRIRHVPLLARPRLWLGRRFLRRVERRVIDRADHVMFASGRDRDALAPGRTENTSVVPNGVDVDYWRRRSDRRGGGAIVFTGAMHYAPNADAALHLIHEVLPRVRRELPDARLLVVGRDPTPPLVAAGELPGVTVTGLVDDVRPYLEQATVFAAPLRFGAGIQNKLLEALAMELPVVASSVATAGLRTADSGEPPVEVADTADAMARRLVAELRSHGADPTPRLQLRQFVSEHFVWRRSGELVHRALEAVAGAGDSDRRCRAEPLSGLAESLNV